MKKPRFISSIALVTMVTLGCAQTSDKKKANPSAAAGPELRWKYETGGWSVLDPYGRRGRNVHRFLCRKLLRLKQNYGPSEVEL